MSDDANTEAAAAAEISEDADLASGDHEDLVEETPVTDMELLREERDRNLDGWRRAQADFENLKRRSAQEVRDRVQQSQGEIVRGLLDLADDFERANREAPPEEESDDPWRQGVAMIAQKLQALLARQQVRPIDTVDQLFDPTLHEAVGALPGRQNEIVAVLRTGYLQGSRVLRATQVMVGDGSVAEPDPEPPNTDESPEPNPEHNPEQDLQQD